MKSKFPGFEGGIRLMHKHNPQLREDGFYALLPHAGEYVTELIAEFKTEERHGLRCWLLELIGAAKSPEALPIFADYLRGEDASLRYWSIQGLKKLDTKEARRILWEARSYTFATEDETRYFYQELDEILTGEG